MTLTIEQFFKKKIQDLNPNAAVITLRHQIVNAEQAIQWAKEFNQLKQVESNTSTWRVIKHKLGGYCVEKNGKANKSRWKYKRDAVSHMDNLKKVEEAIVAKAQTPASEEGLVSNGNLIHKPL